MCNRVHEVEWSGTLFYKVEGSLSDNSLVATCVDIFVMDIGTGTYTEYNEAPAVISYMCEHPELLEEGVFEGLIHSHNNMPTFFSGTDTNTLIEEGTNANHFLSLIVNNAGKYTAGITRKIVEDVQSIIHSTSTKNIYYDSFGNNRVVLEDNTVSESDKEESKAVEYLEWFEAEIDKMEVPNSFHDIDNRLSEIKADKVKNRATNIYGSNTPKDYSNFYNWKPNNDKVSNYSSLPTPVQNSVKGSENWESQQNKEVKEARQLSLFEDDDETMQEDMDSLCLYEHFDEDLLNTLAVQLLTGSVIINPKNVDLEKWVKTMDGVYERRFGPLGFDGKSDYSITCNLERLETWIGSFIEFLVYTRDEDLLRRLNGEDNDPSNAFTEADTAEVCACDLYWLLNELPESKVKDLMMEQLETYLPDDIYKY